ncbi:amidohydrolase [Rhizorhabdus wittichii DC-6]|nr:amidohydrolase [Rhizorhabdus wittichii DC-6]
MFDLVIRNGTVVDGSGAPAMTADIGIAGDRIAAVSATPLPAGREELDASGLLVTPGFVDIHTHYDGQATWSGTLSPSSAHGVTTVVMGNCGIGFAPCRPEDRDRLIKLMEGVEDIPEVVMAEGLPWNWESFPEFLDAVAAIPHDVDIAAYVPHSALRVYAMGQRGADREPARKDDLDRMVALVREALRAGALGVATSRTLVHRTPGGELIPSHDAAEDELQALAGALASEGHGVFQTVMDLDDATADEDFDLLRRIAERSGRPISFSLLQPLNHPGVWKRMLDKLDGAAEDGVPISAQVFGRPVGMLLGLDLSFHPFSFHPSYQEIASLPLAERVEALRRPERRARILAERPIDNGLPFLAHLARYEWMFELGERPDYQPSLDRSIAEIAARTGVDAREIAYDMLLERDGRNIILLPRANYGDGNLDAALAMMRHPRTTLGLGDGGAHCGVICDASLPTFMLTYWARDRAADGLTIEEAVRALTAETAQAVGLHDRGRIAPGFKADVNLIDHGRLTLHAPEMVADLPAGGRRLHQPATGYVATIVNGRVTRRDDAATGTLPGRLVRGAQPAPVEDQGSA